jgi:hypothetical protein
MPVICKRELIGTSEQVQIDSNTSVFVAFLTENEQYKP